MFEFLRQRSGPQSQGLHYSFEKAGLVFDDNQPIPWNAEAVIVEALVKLSAQQSRHRDDFALRLPGREPLLAETMRPGDTGEMCRVFFRLPIPRETTAVEVLWRGRSLGQLTLPVLGMEDFLRHLNLQMTTVSVQLGEVTMQCQTAVTSQCQNILLSAVVSSQVSLVALPDLGLRVRMTTEKGDLVAETGVHFSSSQLRARQALVSAVLPRPRRAGLWQFHWLLGDDLRATQRLRTVTKAVVQRSLRLSATRFILQDEEGRLTLVQSMPTETQGVLRVGPCFWVSSSEPGLAAWCEVEMRAHLNDGEESRVLEQQKVLVSDGPTPVALGTLDVGFLKQVKHFELWCQHRLLGVLPLVPVPSASFNSEGGFRAAEDFSWSPAAEEQLQEKLGRLLK